MKISGRLAQSGDALNFEGTLAGAGLTQISNAASMSRFGQGRIQGQAQLPEGRRVEISGESDLAGMAIDMPAPVGKSAQSSQLLKLQWGSADQGSRGRRWLTASLGTTVNALFERDPASKSASYLRAARSASIARPACRPKRR